ncbi:Uncharacterised protein [uncultured archaeon]|nr:Uncharacterised protein [uncultured archaeon]
MNNIQNVIRNRFNPLNTLSCPYRTASGDRISQNPGQNCLDKLARIVSHSRAEANAMAKTTVELIVAYLAAHGGQCRERMLVRRLQRRKDFRETIARLGKNDIVRSSGMGTKTDPKMLTLAASHNKLCPNCQGLGFVREVTL